MNLKGGKLRRKVLLTMLLGALVPLAVFGILAIYSLNYFHKLDLQTIEQTLLDELAAQMDAAVKQIISTFQLEVTFDQTTDIALNDQHLLLKQLMSQFPELEEASFISASGSQYGRETSVLNRSSGNFAQSSDLSDQSQIEKFKNAVLGKNYISEVYYTLKGPMVTIAAPVKNTPKSGQPSVIAVLNGEIRLEALQRIIYQAHLGNSGYLYLRDNNGFLVSYSQGKGQIGRAVPQHLSQELGTYQNFWQQKVFGMSRKLKSLDANLVAEWPTNDADQIVNTVEQQIIWALFLTIALALLLSFYLASKIVKPIKILEAGAAQVSEGKFDRHVKIDTRDELEQLGGSFNKMMDGLKRLEELKEEFVFVASHELRTPVTAIKGYLSMVLGGEAGVVSEEAKRMLKQVTASNDRLIQLVEDLLQVARSESGRLVIEVAPVDISGEVTAVLNELEPLAREKNIALNYAQTARPPQVLADAARFKEILINLVGNAIKYTPGPGQVNVTHHLRDGALETSVSDSGIGMSAEEQAKLFEKFYRVKNLETKNIQGTGLGLFIVKQIVEKMDGKIWVNSQSGRGSVFSFSLKLAGNRSFPAPNKKAH